MYFLFLDYRHANETVYFGGPILTMSDAQPRVEALYVKNGKILAAGTKAEVMQAKSRRAKLTDLQGKTLLPGFFDAHGHLDLATALYGMTDISGGTHRTPEGVWNAVAQKVKGTPKGEWIFCLGYDPILTKGLEPPSTAFLDSLAPDHPVALIAQTMHSYYANSKAFQAAGITAQTPDPSSSSYYGRDSSGQLTGLIVEQAAFEPFRAIMQEKLMDSFVENTQKCWPKTPKRESPAPSPWG
ncbi:MAG: amidohydrolase family protein [Haliscomenobacter sp.]|nr:amidohydrolase family protein [Haliscomenobacter sp.]